MKLSSPRKGVVGFSLIELLVVISIIGVLMGVGLLSFASIDSQQTLNKNVQTLKNVLYEARQEAFLAKLPVGCTNFQGNRVSITVSTITIQPFCNSVAFGPAKVVNLSSGLTMNPANAVVTFQALQQQTNLASSLNLTVTYSGRSAQLTILPSGEVR